MSMCEGMCTLCASPGCSFNQAIGRGNGAFRMRRSFDRVDVKMIRERMFRIQFQHRIERRQDFIRAGIRLTFRRPLIPRPQIHHRFGEKRADVRVVRIFLPDFAHRIRVGLIERRAIFRLRIGVTMTERLDQVALHRRSVLGVLLREREFLPSQLRGGRRHDRVLMCGPQASAIPQCAIAHFRIEPRRFLKRANRRAVIETVEESEALIEIALRFRRVGRDLARIRTEPLEKRLPSSQMNSSSHQRQTDNDAAKQIRRRSHKRNVGRYCPLATATVIAPTIANLVVRRG